MIVTDNRLRAPALLAKMAATVDQVSNGRLIFGIGVGGSAVKDPAGLALVRREFDAYGFPVVPTGEAIDAFEEACTIVERLWTETEPFDFAGRHYQLTGAICEPKPVQRPRPPILIGAGGRRSLAVVARHADIWNCPTRGDMAMVRDLGRILDEHCAEIGRDPAEIERSVQLLVTTKPSAPTAGCGGPPAHLRPGRPHGRRSSSSSTPASPTSSWPRSTWRVIARFAALRDEIVEPVLEQLGGPRSPSRRSGRLGGSPPRPFQERSRDWPPADPTSPSTIAAR